MSLQRNYYEVLGLAPSATTDQIKKKYRELARKYHPDIAQDKDFSQRVFTQINQAYRVLADPDRRAQYNSTLGAIKPVAPAPAPTPAATRPSAPAAGAASTAASPKAAAPSPERAKAISQLLGNADRAIMDSKPLEARGFCMKVLEIDAQNVRGLVMMGDALVMMGQTEDAAVQYRKALAISPSPLIQSKLSRLEQNMASNKTRELAGKTTRPESGRTDRPQPAAAPEKAAEKSGGLLGRLLGRK